MLFKIPLEKHLSLATRIVADQGDSEQVPPAKIVADQCRSVTNAVRPGLGTVD